MGVFDGEIDIRRTSNKKYLAELDFYTQCRGSIYGVSPILDVARHN